MEPGTNDAGAGGFTGKNVTSRFSHMKTTFRGRVAIPGSSSPNCITVPPQKRNPGIANSQWTSTTNFLRKMSSPRTKWYV
jgi:hypothetical protein